MDVEPGDDRGRRVQRVALAFILLVFAWVLWEAYGPAARVPVSALPPSTPAGELPLARARAFVQQLTWGPTTPFVVGAAIVLLAVAAVRESLREERNEDAPRLFGVLLGVYAFLVPTVWFALSLPLRRSHGATVSLYYLAAALPTLASALYLYYGRRAARIWYGVALIVAWSWSFLEFGLGSKQFWMQVGMPTLIALYLFSWRVSGRLLPAQR